MKLIACALALAATGGLSSIVLAGEQPAPQPGLAQRAATLQPKAQDNLDAQFVEILGKLASTRLERLKRINAASPGAIAPDDVALLELQLKAIDKIRQETKGASQISGFSMLMGLAEVSKASAALEWKRMSALRERSPSSVPEVDAEMARLRAELADVNLMRGRSVATRSVQEQQNWALQFLFVELQGIHDAVRNLEGRQ
jgi:hypothetical protein